MLRHLHVHRESKDDADNDVVPALVAKLPDAVLGRKYVLPDGCSMSIWACLLG